MVNRRAFLFRMALFSRVRPLPWGASQSKGWPWAFLGTACKGNVTDVGTEGEQRERKSLKEESSQNLGFWRERLADQMLPLWRLNYEEQLKVKFESLKKNLETLESRLRKIGAGDPGPTAATSERLCSCLHPFMPSPVIDGYRNKSSFCINRGPDGNPKTVGYYLKSWGGSNIFCVQPSHLKDIPEKHNQVAQCFEAFLRQSTWGPYTDSRKMGPWHELIVRTSFLGHTMAIIIFNPQELSQEELCVQKEEIKEFFSTGPGAVCDLTSLYMKERTPRHQQLTPFQLLAGDPYLFEDILGLKVRISPGAFFQLNTSAAEVLYRTVGELGRVDHNTVIFDFSHGTGATGLSLARQTSQIFSMGLVGQALEDAKWTAAFNGITNWESHPGSVKEIIPQLLGSQEDGRSLTALVDPSQCGLSNRVVQDVRNCKAIQTLVFVSCRPYGKSIENIIELCRPPDPDGNLMGEPFVLRRAVPVDMFPHSLQCELVMLFTR
ncbi:tRNA (uracil(54)-C(5))-methyltransferase homolog [Vombatus ursinus]|uniref:tRNA (uracil(54)-C(5))-methyltransferase n=1 Tax=Vombatus ursinus TaxID=29139 RepID=A0A4X2JSE8_VOMUR|nr:tRNA (uracil(54)-C(5))-methyltransferase homolog [Vombatus ursinus]XP_027715710.1 tRNA (uracil(54)-C(5))-methyltransferase homolog [Vombatus ursinus]